MSSDAFQWWGQDMALTPSGDIATVSNIPRDNQRIFRRLCTNGSESGAQIGEYCFHPTYGGSALWYVGQTTQGLLLEGVIRYQMYLEDSVAHSPEPDITISWQSNGDYTTQIQYTNADTGATVPALTMDVTG